MILDNLTLLSGAMSATGVLSGQAVNGAGSILSANVMDLASLGLGGNQTLGALGGEKINFEITVLTAPTVGTSVRFELIQADDAALTTNVQVIKATGDLPIASLPAGTLIPIWVGNSEPYFMKRYMGLRYVNTGAIATASYLCCMGKDMASVKGMLFKSGIVIA